MKTTMKIRKNVGNDHMGRIIKEAVKERNMSISDFAKAIQCSRTNVYSIFGRKSINIDILEQIVQVLKLNMSDFIKIEKKKSNKSVAIIEINNEQLERLWSEYGVTYIKSWQII